jgi:hypothetical protein
MRGSLFGLSLAGLLVCVTATKASAQVPVVTPNVVPGGFVAPRPPGFTYSSGYVGVQPAVPTTVVTQPTVVAPMPRAVARRGFRMRPYRYYPVAGAYRYRYRPLARRGWFIW